MSIVVGFLRWWLSAARLPPGRRITGGRWICKKVFVMRLKSTLRVYFVLSISIPLVILGLLSYRISSRTIMNISTDSNRLVLQQVNTNIEAHIQEIERISRGVYSNSEAQEALSALKESDEGDRFSQINTALKNLLYSMLSMRNDFTGIYIFPDSGKSTFYVRKGYALREEYSVEAEAWYDEVLQSRGEPFIIGSHVEPQPIRDPEMVFSLVRRIRSTRTGEGLGIMIMNIRNEVINDVCRDANFQEGSTILLFDQEGNISYHNDISLIGSSISDIPSLADADFKTAGTLDYMGRRSRVIREYDASTGFTAVSIIPLRSLYRSSYLIGRTSFVIISIGILLSLIVAGYLASHIIRPMDRLQEQMKKVEEGDFSVTVENTRKDEVGDLSRSFGFMIGKINELIDTVYKIRIRNQEIRLEVLQGKINPHFLYNTLDVMRGIALKHRAMEIIEIIESLAHIFKYSLGKTGDLVSLEEELHYAEHYMRVQSHRFGKRLKSSFEVEDELKQVSTVRFILQPILENSIIHGLEEEERIFLIRLRARRRDGDVILTVADNGRGIEKKRLEIISEAIRQGASSYPEDVPVRTGIGLLNIQSRISLTFGPHYGLTIRNGEENGTVTEVSFPMKGSAANG